MIMTMTMTYYYVVVVVYSAEIEPKQTCFQLDVVCSSPKMECEMHGQSTSASHHAIVG